MKISSYNVNGIRAAYRKGFCDWVAHERPDVICLQEIKADESQIPDEIRELDYHQIYLPAEKKGYSGVAIMSRFEPEEVQAGMGLAWCDQEGRVLRARIKGIDIFSIYAPSGTTGGVRQDLKMKFLEEFKPFAENYLKSGIPVVFCGDFNIAHTELDIHNPVANKNTSGFLPEERAWMSYFIGVGFHDVFREQHPGEADLYSWWTYRAGAKERNKGWRIDYQFSCDVMAGKSVDARIERELNLSDHVPVTVTYAP
jgi:exodeoxyribonuclease III